MYSSERRYEYEGAVFVIRDVLTPRLTPSGVVNKFERCEYAVKASDHSMEWKPCREGVLFSEIEPYEQVAC